MPISVCSQKSKPPVTAVLVTAVGSATGVCVLKALRAQKEISCRIIGTDIYSPREIAGSSFCDSFYRVPRATERDFIPKLISICKKEKIGVLFPIYDTELEKISAHRQDFSSKNICVWVSDPKTVNLCNDKYQTSLFFKKNRILSPRTWLPSQVRGQGVELPFPVIVKPRKGVGSVGIYWAKNAEELRNILQKNDEDKELILQEGLTGEEYTVDVLCDFKGRSLAIVPRKRIEVKAGVSYKGSTVFNPALIKESKKIIRALNIRGACNLQCKLTDKGPNFFEINPRFSAGLSLTVAAGVNGPLILLKLSKGMRLKPDEIKFKKDVYMARYWEEIFYGQT